MFFNNIEYKSMSDMAAEQILQKILNRELKAGDMLPPEVEIAQSLGIGRSTIREALKSLEMMGLLSRRKNGTTIAIPDNKIISKMMQCMVLLRNIDIKKLVELRIIMEPAYIRYAVRNATVEDICILENIVSNSANENEGEQNIDFHEYIAHMSGDEIFILIMDMVRPLFQTLMDVSLQGELASSKKNIQDHKSILEAIKEKKEDLASERMRIHLENLWDNISTGE